MRERGDNLPRCSTKYIRYSIGNRNRGGYGVKNAISNFYLATLNAAVYRDKLAERFRSCSLETVWSRVRFL